MLVWLGKRKGGSKAIPIPSNGSVQIETLILQT